MPSVCLAGRSQRGGQEQAGDAARCSRVGGGGAQLQSPTVARSVYRDADPFGDLRRGSGYLDSAASFQAALLLLPGLPRPDRLGCGRVARQSPSPRSPLRRRKTLEAEPFLEAAGQRKIRF